MSDKMPMHYGDSAEDKYIISLEAKLATAESLVRDLARALGKIKLLHGYVALYAAKEICDAALSRVPKEML